MKYAAEVLPLALPPQIPIKKGLFLFKRGEHHGHALAFKRRHVLGPAVRFQFHRKAEQLIVHPVIKANFGHP